MAATTAAMASATAWANDVAQQREAAKAAEVQAQRQIAQAQRQEAQAQRQEAQARRRLTQAQWRLTQAQERAQAQAEAQAQQAHQHRGVRATFTELEALLGEADLFADGASPGVDELLPPLGPDFGEYPEPDQTYLFV